MTLAYRQRRISECIRRYQPMAIGADKHGVRDVETGCIVDGAIYEDPELARVQCRMLAAADIERLYLPDRATAVARIRNLIEATGVGAAELIADFYEGSKA